MPILRAALFSAEATELDAQSLYEHSFDFRPGQQRLCSLDELRGMVLARLPLEARFVGAGEHQLLEKLLINDGELLLTDWDDLGAAEALLSRLWCSFRAEGRRLVSDPARRAAGAAVDRHERRWRGYGPGTAVAL